MDDNKDLQLNTIDDIVRTKPNDVFNATEYSLEDLQNTFSYYKDCLDNFSAGTTKVELRKRYMLKVLDEVWVKMLEDSIPSIDAIIRNPNGGLEDFEEVKPIELTRKVVSKSVVHLSQHTDLINEIRKDGTVMPSKLLNVYNDETLYTYENKFINTLIQRLYAFVMLRYDAAIACGEDERNTVFTYSQKFEEGERRGKINVSIEVADPPKEGEVIKNYIYTTDLWKRVIKIVEMTKACMASPFVKDMGKNYIHPPVMRTNKLLKNVNFNQCLQLWDFLDQYENTGYETMVQESLEDVEDNFLKNFYNAVIAQYVLFNKTINNDFNPENTLDERTTDIINAKVKDELDELNEREYDLSNLVPGKKKEGTIEATGEEDNIDFALQVALCAEEEMMDIPEAIVTEDEDEEEIVKDKSFVYMFNYSFLGRLILAQDPCMDFYNQVKNKILSYDNVYGSMTWKYESFKSSGTKLIKLMMRGKTLCVYYNLDPETYLDEEYKMMDLSGSKSRGDYPLMIKVKNQKYCNKALELIEELMVSNLLSPIEGYLPSDWHRPYIDPIGLCRLKPPLAKLLNGELPPLDEEEDSLEIRYNYSFIGRLSKAESLCQTYYTGIKNKILSYKEVEDSISWKHELFREKRNKLCLLNIKGKTLCLYLPLDPDEYVDSKFKVFDVSEKKAFVDTPLLFKVKNEKNFKVALELIESVMVKFQMKKISRPDLYDYHIPTYSVEELMGMNPPLVREKGDKIETPVFNPEDYRRPLGKEKIIRNNYAFRGRLILAQNPTQDYYTILKNEILSYENINGNLSWKHELFKSGKNKIAQFVMKGKTLNVFLPLNPDEYVDSKYKFVDGRNSKPNTDLPFLMKITSDRKVNHVVELISIIMNNLNINKLAKFKKVDYHERLRTVLQLAKMDPPLVKLGGTNDAK